MTTGPPRVALKTKPVSSMWGWPRPAAMAFFSTRLSSCHFGFVMSVRKLPWKRLPPLFVTALITPPEKRPYSAEIPEVMIETSCSASSMKRFVGVPKRLSLMSTPFSRNTLS